MLYDSNKRANQPYYAYLKFMRSNIFCQNILFDLLKVHEIEYILPEYIVWLGPRFYVQNKKFKLKKHQKYYFYSWNNGICSKQLLIYLKLLTCGLANFMF